MRSWRSQRLRIGLVALVATVGVTASLARAGVPKLPARGGRLVVALRVEPSTLNPTTSYRTGEHAVIGRLHAALVILDRDTLEPVPSLAESWEVSAEGRVLDVELRRGLRFSDGEPFDAEDVIFTFETLLDPENAAPQRSTFLRDGEPVRVTATSSHSVRFEWSKPRAAAVRMLEGVWILPSHRIRSQVEAGVWSRAWGVATRPGEMVGLGPFRLARYRAGERLVLERNPFYWKRDSRGERLPYLDELEFVFVPGEDAEVVRFAAGDTDIIDHVSPEDFQVLQRGGEDRIMTDVGPGLSYSLLVFNLNDLTGRNLPAVEARQAWFRRRGFREAVSLGIDRMGIARVVYRGRAAPLATLDSPASGAWRNPALEPPRRDPEAARQALQEAGFRWRSDGALIDEDGQSVRFSILVSATSSTRRRIASLLQRDLAGLGISADTVPFDHRSLVERVVHSFDFDAVLLEVQPHDAGPMAHFGTLVSGGSTHLWRMGVGPVNDWEAELDRLMEEEVVSVEPDRRRALYHRVQEIFARELPFITLVSPNVLVGRRVGLGGCRPSVLDHHLLWNADELYWESQAR
jgi:peptide/nickel transport system substrate-binding protein